MNAQQLVEAFLGYKATNKNRSKSTIGNYRLALTRYLEFLAGRDPREATLDDLVAFTGPWLHKRGLTASARRPHVSAVKEFCRWMVMMRMIETTPAELLEHPSVGRQLPHALRLASAEKLIWAPDLNTFEGVRDAAILAILVGCGVRVSSIVKMNRSSLIEEVVEKRPRIFLKVSEKGDRERLVPVPQEADLMLRVYLEHPALKEIDTDIGGDHVLFVSMRNRNVPRSEYRGENRRLNRRAINDIMAKHGRRAGVPIDQLHPHAARHLYGAEFTESDIPLLVTQQLMGHVDPKSTQIYTSVALRKLVRSVDEASPLAKMRTPVTELLQRLQSSKPTRPA